MSERTQLLIVDPQNDFCDLPAGWRAIDPLTGTPIAPALAVAGAHADMLRLAQFIRAQVDAIDAITLTLDSHHRFDIAHPAFWSHGDGSAVAPFTPIAAAQVRTGEFAPRDERVLPRVLDYLDELERRGRYALMVWPPHCLIGSWGHGVHAAIQAACGEWEERRQRVAHCVHKGANPWTEHYSALQAEVPLADDPGTQLDRALLERLGAARTILVAGEAGSHCVKASTEDLLDHLPGGRPGRIVLLTDAMSPVAGFERMQSDFIAAMRARGVRASTLAEAAALLRSTAAD